MAREGNMKKIDQKGVIFSTELTIAVIAALLLISAFAMLTSNNAQPENMQWKESLVAISTQTKMLTEQPLQPTINTPQYYCYSLFGVGRAQTSSYLSGERKNCEEIQ